MPTPYFSKFPKIIYDIDGTGLNSRAIVDIVHRAKFLDIVKQNTIVFYPYIVKEGETPEIIAAKLYDSPQFHWIVLYSNDIINLWEDWPLPYEHMIAFLTKKYGSIATAQTTVDHYEAANGDTIDFDTYNALFSQGSKIIYADQYWFAQNEAKKQIQLVDPKYATMIDTELNNDLIAQPQ